MCAVKKELVIDFAELHSLEVHCGKCGTKITIDFDEESITPSKCPSCGEEFGGGYS
jgi:ribosomal protein S27E